MWSKVLASVLMFSALAFSQTHLDPANFPSYGSPTWCDTTGKIAAYQNQYKGISPYSVGLGLQIPNTGTSAGNPARYYAPVIDGILEDSVWYNAETLLINSWEMASYDGCCNVGGTPNFYGAKDMHAIWRFFYNHDGLYVGAEIHDDIYDVDSLSGWFLQDGVEIGIDPWDWGDFAAGHWTAGEYRRYWSNNSTLIPSGCVWATDNSALHYMHLLKRLNEEPYLTGLIRGKHLATYTRGDEATNFEMGRPDVYGLQFAVGGQGVDPWFRDIHHLEFKFPYNDPTPWTDLRSMGFFDAVSGLPKAGNLFKMSFADGDDDIPGPNGANPTNTSSGNWRADPFFMEEPSGHDHWSDTKYYPTFKYESRTIQKAHLFSGTKEYEDNRVAGLWVDQATETARYAFSGGAVTFGTTSYFYDSVGAGSANRGVIYNSNKDSVGHYVITWAEGAGTKSFSDVLNVSLGGTQYALLRFLATGFTDIVGRWVEVKDQPDTVAHDYCDTAYISYSPKPNAREFRFCSFSRMDTTAVPAFKGSTDSLRVYDYATGAFQAGYTYTDRQVIRGRTGKYYSFELTRLLDRTNTAAPRHLVVTTDNGDSTVIFQEIKPYPLINLGESGNNVNKTMTLNAKVSSTDSLLKMYVFDKYSSKVNLYPTPSLPTYKYRIVIYPDGVLCTDSSKAFAWNKVFGCTIALDSFELLNYDKIAKTATGLGTKEDTAFWADSAWILQRHTIVFSSPVSSDTFVMQDTTQVVHWEDLAITRPTGIFNLIDPSRCPGIEEGADASVDEVAISQYPNPFNPTTTIRFVIPGNRAGARYMLNVYNVRGQLVRTLVKGVVDRFGVKKQMVWNGMDNAGNLIGSGVYYYQLQCGAFVKRGALVMVK